MNQAFEVYKRLDELSPSEIRFLDERDPFRFLISVILSAQTTDRIVNSVTKDLFSKYPDAPSLAAADLKDVEEIVYPTGFYRNKAKNIIAASKALGEEAVPDTMEELIKLPGVGRKTASCILGDIYDKPAISGYALRPGCSAAGNHRREGSDGDRAGCGGAIGGEVPLPFQHDRQPLRANDLPRKAAAVRDLSAQRYMSECSLLSRPIRQEEPVVSITAKLRERKASSARSYSISTVPRKMP